MTVDVAVRATNAELTEGAGRRVTVPANDRVEVRFPVAAVKPGTARFQVAAAVRRASRRRRGLAARLHAGHDRGVRHLRRHRRGRHRAAGQGAGRRRPKFGGLEVTTASTQLQELTDAVHLPPQLPVRVHRADRLARHLASPRSRTCSRPSRPKDLPAARRDARGGRRATSKRLQVCRTTTAASRFWRRGEQSWPYVSVHVAHALARARRRRASPCPSDDARASRKSTCATIERSIPDGVQPRGAARDQAYALYVRALMGDRDAATRAQAPRRGGRRRKALARSARLAAARALGRRGVAAESRRRSAATSTTASPRRPARRTSPTRYGDGAYTAPPLRPPRRRRAARRADRRPAAAATSSRSSCAGCSATASAGAGRTRRRTSSSCSRSTATSTTYEKATPDFVARVWLGDDLRRRARVQGRTTERQQIEHPDALRSPTRTARRPST